MAKFKGNNGDDAIIGTALDDDIDGKHGNDTLSGLGGNDNIRGQHGMDDISGGDGNDTLIGHHDSDTVHGGDGDDVVFGDVGGNGPGSSYWNSSDGPGDGDSSDDLVDGGAGNDYVFGGGGNDEAIYDLTENAGAMDYYAGGSGIDTLTLTMTLSDWFRIEVQNDIAAFLNFVAVNTDPLTGEANGQGFDFAAFGLTAREFEDMRVFVDGVELSPEDDPVTANDDSASLTEDDGDTALRNVLTNDVVPDLVYQVALVSGPAKGILTFNEGLPGAPDGSFSYDPNGEFEYLALGESEDVTFVYEVTDANRDTDQATVTITVDGVNDPPVANDDAVTTGENTAVTVDVLANDTDVDTSDTHTVDAVAIASGFGSVSISGNQVHWDPGTDYDYLAVGESAQVVIDYDMSDNNGGTDSAQLVITVDGVNDDPVANDDVATTDENTAVTVDVLANDTDVDTSDTHTVDAVEITSGLGSVSITGNQVHWDPGTDYDYLAVGESAQVVIDYDMSDNNNGGDSAQLVITVDGVNDDPVANDDAVTTGENTAVTVDVLANDTDVDTSDTHTVDAVAIASGFGSVSISGNQVHWDPGTDYDYLAVGESAQVVIDYDMSDNNGGTDSAQLVITVDGVNDDPVANDDAATTDEDTPVDIDVLANDTDVDASDDLMPSAFSALHGTVDLNNDGTLRYTPDANYFGPDTLSYTVSDGNGGTATAEVAITVNPVNDPPVSLDLPEVANEADGPFYIIQLDDQVLDVDGDNLTFSFINIDRGATPIPFEVFGADNEFIRINVEALGLDTGDSLSTQFRYRVSDGNGETDTGFVPLTINGADDTPPPANRAPKADAHSIDANEGGGTIVIPISSFASDPDGDALLVTALTGTVMGVSGSNVAFSQREGNILIDPRQFFVQEGEPVPEDSGDLILSGDEEASLALSFTVEDPAGLSASNVITLNLTGDEPDLTPRNVAPTALNIPGAPGYPSVPDFPSPTPGTVVVDDPTVTTFTIDFDDLIGDPDNGQPGDLADPLEVTPGNLVIGGSDGTPITVPYSFDDTTNEMVITLANFGLADGESVLATMTYEVAEGPDVTRGQIVINFTNPAPPDTPPAPDSRVLDFESFAADPGFVIPLGTLNVPVGSDAIVPNYQGLIFQGSAAVIETNELGGGSGRDTGSSGIVNGQTTPGEDSHNVLVGTFNTLRVPVTDPDTGEPVLDRNGDPLFETVQDNDFAMLAPGMSFGIGDPGQLFSQLPAGSTPSLPTVLPESVDNTFNLDGLSLNVIGNDGVTVTATTYRLAIVEGEPTGFGGLNNYYYALVAADTFNFTADASTPAEIIDFNTVAGPITDVRAFDDIYAISFATDDGSAMVFDDILFTV